MTEQDRAEAFRYIEAQLEYGYIDLGAHDEYELEIIREAINMLKAIDKFNSIGCTSFKLAAEDVEQAMKQMETADDIVGCTIKWVTGNGNRSEV